MLSLKSSKESTFGQVTGKTVSSCVFVNGATSPLSCSHPLLTGSGKQNYLMISLRLNNTFAQMSQQVVVDSTRFDYS